MFKVIYQQRVRDLIRDSKHRKKSVISPGFLLGIKIRAGDEFSRFLIGHRNYELLMSLTIQSNNTQEYTKCRRKSRALY